MSRPTIKGAPDGTGAAVPAAPLPDDAQTERTEGLVSRAFFGAVVFSIMLDELRPAVGGGFSAWSAVAVAGGLLIAAGTLPRLRAEYAAQDETRRGVLRGVLMMLGALGLGAINFFTQSAQEAPLHLPATLITWLLGLACLALPWRSEGADRTLSITGTVLCLVALLGRWLL